jgi:SAM-dependent methyltransferase
MSHETLARTVAFDFTRQNLPSLVAGCASDPLMGIISRWFPPGARVLEAGAGSGKWLKALNDGGYAMQGIEINGANVDSFRALWPAIPFDQGDVERLPYDDGSFDAILSLGVVEHMIHGPERALVEMARALKPGGVIILTVPDANILFRLERVKDWLFHRLYRWNGLRRLLGKPLALYSRAAEQERLTAIRRNQHPGWPIKHSFSPDHGQSFYEYRFTPATIAGLMVEAGFEVAAVERLYHADRLYQVFGRLVGRGGGGLPITLNPLGRLLNAILPSHWFNHMALIVARRPVGRNG